MFGWRGRLLRVNLTNGDIKNEKLDSMALSAALGGLGLGVWLLSKETTGNPLCFVTGPLIGTVAPNGGRFFITARNPEGKIIGASISGKWGAELKYAGCDAIVFEGEASEPVYLWLKDGQAELVSATHVWGKKVSETTYALLGETDPQAVVACIGPAGENRVTAAIVVGDILSASGTGFGAMMGARNLKAVVVRGTEGFRVADRIQFSKQATTLRSHMAKSPIAARGARMNGSMLMADSLSFEPETAEVAPARTRGCFSCATCFSSFSYDEGKEVLPLSAGEPPAELNERSKEYRTFMDFGLDYASVSGLSKDSNSVALAQQLAQGGDTEPVAAETPAIQRGPCMFAGYAIVPRISSCENDLKRDTMAAVLDSVGLCPFLIAGIDMNTIAELMSTATGVAFSEEQIAQAGQRILLQLRQPV